jgi:ubiquinone/menaquinone biosynthesis C-methylase UbiE
VPDCNARPRNCSPRASRCWTERGLANIEILAADARHTGLLSGSFDLVHGRTLLVTIPEPGDVLAEMVRLVSPGPALRALSCQLRPVRCRSAHRPPAD